MLENKVSIWPYELLFKNDFKIENHNFGIYDFKTREIQRYEELFGKKFNMKRTASEYIALLLHLYGVRYILVDGNETYEYFNPKVVKTDKFEKGKEVFKFTFSGRKEYTYVFNPIIDGEYTFELYFNDIVPEKSTCFNVLGNNQKMYFNDIYYRDNNVTVDFKRIMDVDYKKHIYIEFNHTTGYNSYITESRGFDLGEYKDTFEISYWQWWDNRPCGQTTKANPSFLCTYSDDGIYKDLYGRGTIFTKEEDYKKYKH